MIKSKARDVKALLIHQKDFIIKKLNDKNCKDQYVQMHYDLEKVEKRLSQIEKYF